MQPEKSYNLLSDGKRIFDVRHGGTRLFADFRASPFVRLPRLDARFPVQFAEDFDQFVIRAAGAVVQLLAALIERAHPAPIGPGMANHGVPAQYGNRVVGKFQFQDDIDDSAADFVGENGFR